MIMQIAFSWSRLFQVKPGQRTISESVECGGVMETSSEKMGVFHGSLRFGFDFFKAPLTAAK